MQAADLQAYLLTVEQLPKCINCGQPVRYTLEMRYVAKKTGSRKFRRVDKRHTVIARCEDCWVADTLRYHGNSQTANLVNDPDIT